MIRLISRVALAAFSLAAVSNVNLALADDGLDHCPPVTSINTGVHLTGALLDQVNDFDKRLVLAEVIHDFNGDGAKDFLSVEGSDLRTVRIRDGRTLGSLWEYQLPANSVPTYLRSIGNVPAVHVCSSGIFGGSPPSSGSNDSIPEFAVGVRFINGGSGDGVFVFNGANGSLIAKFPSIISNIDNYDHSPESYPVFPNSPNVSGMSAVVAPTRDGMRLVYGASDSLGGVGIYLDCYRDQVNMRQVEEYKMIRSSASYGPVTHNLMGIMLNISGPGGYSRLIGVDHSLDYHEHVGPLEDPNLVQSGALIEADSGATNFVPNILANRYSHQRAGFAAENVGDIDGDGYDDIALSSPGDNECTTDRSFVDILSGRTSNFIHTKTETETGQGTQFGYAVTAGVDLTENGSKDLVISAPTEGGTGRVKVYNGPTFTKTYELAGANQAQGFGQSVVIPEPNRLIVVDRAGTITLYRLGIDVVGNPETGGPNGSPDYCGTTGTGSGLAVDLQKVVDDIYKATRRIHGLYVSFRSEHNSNSTSSRKRQKALIKSMGVSATKIKTLVTDHEAEITVQVYSALVPLQGQQLEDFATQALALFNARRNPNSKIKGLNIKNNLITSFVQSKVTPALIRR